MADISPLSTALQRRVEQLEAELDKLRSVVSEQQARWERYADSEISYHVRIDHAGRTLR